MLVTIHFTLQMREVMIKLDSQDISTYRKQMKVHRFLKLIILFLFFVL
jgi:hypothetical protein